MRANSRACNYRAIARGLQLWGSSEVVSVIERSRDLDGLDHRLHGAVEPIAGVTEAGDDVADLVEVTVDPAWQWRSFLTSGVTAVYFLIYAIHYFFSKLQITGTASTILYFGYTMIMVLIFA